MLNAKTLAWIKELNEVFTILNANDKQNLIYKDDVSLTPARYGESINYPEFM